MDRRFDAYARTHHGLITRSVAERLGMSTSSWYRQLDRGRLIQLSSGVARVAGAPVTREQRTLAAVLGAGDEAMASHRSSAWLWGVSRPESDPIDVIVNRTARPTIDGADLHRPTDRAELRAVIRRGIPTTDPLRMLVDLGAVDPAGVYPAMESIIIGRLAYPSAVISTLERHAAKGRSGIVALRDAIARYPFAVTVADSVFETRMADVVRRYRLPAMTFHERIRGWEVDFRIDGTNIILECDGRRFHEADSRQFERDRRRDQELIEHGWIVVRFTWTQLTRSPSGVAQRIKNIVERWSP